MPNTATPTISESRSRQHRPLIAITMGDPLSIGPEIIVKALHDQSLQTAATFHIHGLAREMNLAAAQAGIEPFWITHKPKDTAAAPPAHPNTSISQIVVIDYTDEHATFSNPSSSHAPTAAGGKASFDFIERAITSTRLPPEHPARAHAIVTAPISKTSWDMASLTEFPGHTELLAARYNATRHAMLFVGRQLRVILVTIHIPLSRVPTALTTEGILNAIQLGHIACTKLGIAAPRIAVCGLNPHAGEGGILGTEDDRIILPAIQQAKQQGINATGPLPGDAVFVSAAKGAYDLVVAMYHDQGLIPIKLLERELTVNVTAGLPHPHAKAPDEWLIRTSPAHGTAFDIADKNLASPASMIAALQLAIRLS
ncbi:MAG: 4-hydroxythreonine-4-phosphate dehydrogenase PdxA [Pyrinomonadaceae bacterium]|nr:4-hydroxythreonine-4-phosphate dehydrogenase PdxA [Phycisphaerales bacterium]